MNIMSLTHVLVPTERYTFHLTRQILGWLSTGDHSLCNDNEVKRPH